MGPATIDKAKVRNFGRGFRDQLQAWTPPTGQFAWWLHLANLQQN